MQTRDEVLSEMQSLAGRLERRKSFLESKSRKYSARRLVLFLAGAALTIAAFRFDAIAGWGMLLISGGMFSWTVHLHNVVLRKIRRGALYGKILKENISRANLNWDEIPFPFCNEPPEDMSLAKDLDLFGTCSLHHYLDRSATRNGSALLRKIISRDSPLSNESSLTDAGIVKELSAFGSFSDKFILKSRLVTSGVPDYSSIAGWFSENKGIHFSPALLPVHFLLSSAFVLSLIISFATGNSYWLIPMLVNLSAFISVQKKVNASAKSASEMSFVIRHLCEMILFVNDSLPEKATLTRKRIEALVSGKAGASEKLTKMRRILSLLLYRQNPFTRIFLNLIFPYDLFVCMRLQRTASVIETEIQNWIDDAVSLECYLSLANFARLNPDYSYAEFTVEENKFAARSLGHPLLKRDSKTLNDFSFQKKNEIVIITGSNMSGKSTFLKTIGINLCLAYAGAPVNASMFAVSPFEIFTCIKVTDSVVDGVSYFYAEVKKLKKLLDRLEIKNDRNVLFLIDEIFKGTNNVERLAGSSAYIRKLAEYNASGFVTTHDLELVNLSNENRAIDNYHFREEISAGRMIFDYKIREGPCPSTNALKIMKLSGLPVE